MIDETRLFDNAERIIDFLNVNIKCKNDIEFMYTIAVVTHFVFEVFLKRYFAIEMSDKEKEILLKKWADIFNSDNIVCDRSIENVGKEIWGLYGVLVSFLVTLYR